MVGAFSEVVDMLEGGMVCYQYSAKREVGSTAAAVKAEQGRARRLKNESALSLFGHTAASKRAVRRCGERVVDGRTEPGRVAKGKRAA